MRIAVALILFVSLSGRDGRAAKASINPAGILSFLKQAMKLVNNLIDIANGGGDTNSEELLRQFASMDDSIQGLSQGVDSIIELLKDRESEEERLEWNLTIETLESLLRDVTSAYDRFLFYQKNASAIEQFTLQQFAETVVSHESNSPQSAMYNLRDVVLGRTLLAKHQGKSGHSVRGRQRRYFTKQGLFRQLKSMVEASRLSVCGFGKSPQQAAFGLYGTLAVVLAKTYSMTQFAYMLLRLFGKGSFTAESEFFRQSYTNISVAVALEASAVMGQLPPVFWRCDPARHERGTTYEEVTELLQGHLENEVDLSASGSCAGSCSDYRTARARGCYGASSSDMFCEHQRPCKGTLHDCRFVAKSATVCLADSTLGTHRRYNWISNSDGHVHGRKDDPSLGACDGTRTAYSWLRGFVCCSSCFCLCDDDTHSERYFSLLPVVTDVPDKIVTGVRFVKIDRVFYIQLEQGVPDSLGHVIPSTIQWKPIDRRIDLSKDVQGRDFVRLSYRHRSILLQELWGSRGQVVTGASFQIVGGHLSLKIQVTAISDVAARTPSRGVWLAGSVPDPAPPPLRLPSGPVPPTQSAARNWPDGRPGQTLTFEVSSLHMDAAQTTLPLLDAQPVAPRPAVWLAGVGLYHKGQKGGGGFLGLSVQTANMTLTEEDQKMLLKASRRLTK